jgi:hypothetical protein
MDVAVNTVVKDAAGRQKRNSKSAARFIFRGYNGQSGQWSFRSNSGILSLKILHDSVAGNFAVIDAFTSIAPRPGDPAEMIITGGQPGEPFVIRVPAKDCHQFEMAWDFPYPKKKCYDATFYARRDASGGLSIERFAVDIGALPAAGKMPYLGDGQIRKIHADGEVQLARLEHDAKPFLIPKRITTTLGSDKGTMVVTNAYTLRVEPRRKK